MSTMPYGGEAAEPNSGGRNPSVTVLKLAGSTGVGATSLFEQLDDDRFRPTELARWPWDPDALHGGPPAALLAGVLERAIHVMFAREGVEHRVVAGRFEDPGPTTDWIRLAAPMVDGRGPTPLERVMAAADFGNGVSMWFDMGDVLLLNPDLTVDLHRLRVGEWVCVDAVPRLGPEGVGVAESVLFDEQGPIDRATQSLLVEAR